MTTIFVNTLPITCFIIIHRSKLPGRHSTNVSSTENSTSSNRSSPMIAREAANDLNAILFIDAGFLMFNSARSIGQMQACKTKIAVQPSRRIVFCSWRSRLENSGCRRAPLMAAKNIWAATSYCTASPINIRDCLLWWFLGDAKWLGSAQSNYPVKRSWGGMDVGIMEDVRRWNSIQYPGKVFQARLLPLFLRL